MARRKDPSMSTSTETGSPIGVEKVYRAEGSNEQSVPILYDKHAGRIVNNESAEILRMLNAAAGSLASTLPDGARHDLYPDHPDMPAETTS